MANVSRFSGLTRLVAALPQKPGLLVFNYHRIGDPSRTPYDAEVFSATADAFDAQVAFVKRHFHVATLEEAIDMVDKPAPRRGTSVLFTFDDGYLDNYESAFPILAAHGLQGVFFLPTSYIGTRRLAWWDEAAYVVKHSRKTKFRLPLPECEIDIGAQGVASAIARVLDVYRRQGQTASEAFLNLLREACDTARPNGDAPRCFMNWDEAAAMLRGGMAVGSHAHSHEILSRLSAEEQSRELAMSRAILEERLGTTVRALSYPVGLPHCFTRETRAAALNSGYRIAFSFYGGLNVPGRIDPYDTLRHSVAAGSPIGRYQLQSALAAVTGGYWF